MFLEELGDRWAIEVGQITQRPTNRLGNPEGVIVGMVMAITEE